MAGGSTRLAGGGNDGDRTSRAGRRAVYCGGSEKTAAKEREGRERTIQGSGDALTRGSTMLRCWAWRVDDERKFYAARRRQFHTNFLLRRPVPRARGGKRGSAGERVSANKTCNASAQPKQFRTATVLLRALAQGGCARWTSYVVPACWAARLRPPPAFVANLSGLGAPRC